MVRPEELLYNETHEWVRVEEEGGQKVATIGITDHAAGEYGQPWIRIITVGLPEQLTESVRPVLRSHLVAVGHDMLEGLSIRHRHAGE